MAKNISLGGTGNCPFYGVCWMAWCSTSFGVKM